MVSSCLRTKARQGSLWTKEDLYLNILFREMNKYSRYSCTFVNMSCSYLDFLGLYTASVLKILPRQDAYKMNRFRRHLKHSHFEDTKTDIKWNVFDFWQQVLLNSMSTKHQYFVHILQIFQYWKSGCCQNINRN